MTPTVVRVLTTLLLAVLLSGCTSSIATNSTPPGERDERPGVRLLENGGFAVDVPVHVYLLGFDPSVADGVQARLEPTTLEYGVADSPMAFPFDSQGPVAMPGFTDTSSPALVLPTAQFRVHDLDAVTDAAFLREAPSWRVDDAGAPAQYNANAAEAWIADALRSRGVTLDREAPVFVILHAGEALGAHGWRHTFSHGHLDQVRIFGEREPVTVFDVSADEDPYVVRNATNDPSAATDTLYDVLNGAQPVRPDHAYNHPLDADGERTVEAISELVVDAARYRFVKAPMYPVSTKPCHHVTLVFAVHATALSDGKLPDYRQATDWVDAARLQRHFTNLTGDEVSVDLNVLRLPVDDPVLDGLTRSAGTIVALDALRWYLHENWETFVTPQEGCEEYLSMLLYGDAASQGAYGGVGMYDVTNDRRISFSRVWDVDQATRDPAMPLADELGRPEDFRSDGVNWLYAHETGHLFGLHHPQHYVGADSPGTTNPAFEAVYSTMTYQTTFNTDFGAVDYATWNLGRAGYTVRDARALGLEETPAFKQALHHLQKGHWSAAHEVLEPHLQHAASSGPDADAHVFHAVDLHRHPWPRCRTRGRTRRTRESPTRGHPVCSWTPRCANAPHAGNLLHSNGVLAAPLQSEPAACHGMNVRRSAFLVLVLLATVLSGCLGSGGDAGSIDAEPTANLVSSSDSGLTSAPTTLGIEPLRWTGQCRASCPVFAFEVVLPEDADMRLEASITWDYRPYDFVPHAYTSSLHRAGAAEAATVATDLYFSSVSVLEAPGGAYELRVHAAPGLDADVPFEAVVQLEPAPTPDANGDFLPNLGALVPAHLAVFDEPVYLAVGAPVLGSGCLVEEYAEQESRRCLRFSSGFTNSGTGDLVAHLDDSKGPERDWVQVIQTTDGPREVPAGAARFHPFHGHYHYEGALEATVYEYDLDGLERGTAVHSGRKTGFCFEDWGLADPGAPDTARGGYACLEGELPAPVEIALSTLDPTMGVSAGWYDLYVFSLPDQFVDIEGVPDGVYELVNVADPDGTLVESDTSDNEASVVFRLTGNDVEILGTPDELRAG